MVLLAIAAALAGVFFGAALYVNVVEHPARVACGTVVAVQEFRPSYSRAAVMQGTLAVVGCLVGLAAAWQLRDLHIAINAILLGLVVPITLVLIRPINNRLLHPGLDAAGAQAAQLLVRWNRLHGIRTVLGGLAFVLMLFRMVLRGAT